MPGAQCTHSLACKNNKTHELATTGPPGFSPDIPARVGFNRLLRALPGDQVFLTPSLANEIRQLDANQEASGPHDLAVRFNAVRQGRLHVHRIPFRVRDDREPPPSRERDGVYVQLLWVFCKSEYFYQRG